MWQQARSWRNSSSTHVLLNSRDTYLEELPSPRDIPFDSNSLTNSLSRVMEYWVLWNQNSRCLIYFTLPERDAVNCGYLTPQESFFVHRLRCWRIKKLKGLLSYPDFLIKSVILTPFNRKRQNALTSDRSIEQRSTLTTKGKCNFDSTLYIKIMSQLNYWQYLPKHPPENLFVLLEVEAGKWIPGGE